MKKIFSKYRSKILQTQFFAHNDFKANLIFVLGILLMFIIAEDLSSELAKEKNELGNIVATLTVTIDSIHFNQTNPLNYIPDVIAYLTIEDINYTAKHFTQYNSGRSPPQI